MSPAVYCEKCGKRIHYIFDPPDRGMGSPDTPDICFRCIVDRTVTEGVRPVK